MNDFEVRGLMMTWGGVVETRDIYDVLKKSLNLPHEEYNETLYSSKLRMCDDTIHLIFTPYNGRKNNLLLNIQKEQLQRIYKKTFDIPGISFSRYADEGWNKSKIFLNEQRKNLSRFEDEDFKGQCKISCVTVASIFQSYFHNRAKIEDMDLLNRVLHWIYTCS